MGKNEGEGQAALECQYWCAGGYCQSRNQETAWSAITAHWEPHCYELGNPARAAASCGPPDSVSLAISVCSSPFAPLRPCRAKEPRSVSSSSLAIGVTPSSSANARACLRKNVVAADCLSHSRHIRKLLKMHWRSEQTNHK